MQKNMKLIEKIGLTTVSLMWVNTILTSIWEILKGEFLRGSFMKTGEEVLEVIYLLTLVIGVVYNQIKINGNCYIPAIYGKNNRN